MELFISHFTFFDTTFLFLLLLGTLLGIVIGILPGMGPTVAAAVMLPFTIGMEPIHAIAFLLAIYCAGTYGGSISAILINTPGTPAAAATCLDGYPLAQRGEAGRALGIATVSSTIGGIVSVIVFMAAAPLMAGLAYQFGPAEYFGLVVFGLSMLAAIGGHPLKSIVAGGFGVLLSTVGLDLMTGIGRFTFGSSNLSEGISFVPVLVGLFAITEFLVQSNKLNAIVERISLKKVRLPGVSDYKRIWKYWISGSAIGTFIGILPAEGGTVASIVSYNEARRWSIHREEFGKGAIEGIASAETANNAATAGAMVPTLTLGIPGSGTTAVILAALLMHGVRPGPHLFAEQPDFFYGISIAMLLANVFFFILGMAGARYFARVSQVPKRILWPLVFVISVCGAYALNQSMTDVVIMLVSGFIGFFMRRYGFSVLALAVGLILGELLETTLRQSLLVFRGDFTQIVYSPVAMIFIIFSLLAIFAPVISPLIKKMRGNKEVVSSD